MRGGRTWGEKKNSRDKCDRRVGGRKGRPAPREQHEWNREGTGGGGGVEGRQERGEEWGGGVGGGGERERQIGRQRASVRDTERQTQRRRCLTERERDTDIYIYI